LYEDIAEVFQRHCGEGNVRTLDEVKLPWHSRSCPLISYTAPKSHPWGIDVWSLCARLTND
jgi:hypothetical protein